MTKDFLTVRHWWPMLLFGNTYNKQELLVFDQRVRKALGDNFEYVCELKFDGLSMSELGAATRGWANGILRNFRPSARRTRRAAGVFTVRGLARACVGGAGLALVLAILGVGALLAMLASGPIDLQSLNPSLTRSLEERLGPGYRVSIGSTHLIEPTAGRLPRSSPPALYLAYSHGSRRRLPRQARPTP